MASLFASLSGIYAAYTVFGSVWLAILCAVPWAIIIFSLDRYIISSMRHRGNLTNARNRFLQNLLLAIPRLLLAIVIGVVISTPLRLAYFKQEIETQIQAQQERPLVEVENEITRKEAELSSLNATLQAEASRLDEILDSYLTEAQGRGRTGVRGQGAVARTIRDIYERTENDFRQTKSRIEQQVTEISADLAVLKVRREELQSQSQREQPKSLFAKLEALSVVAHKDNRLALANYSILFLMVLIEVCPVLLKLLSSEGPYEDLLDSMSAEPKDESGLHSEDINSDLQKAFAEALDHSSLRPMK